MTAVPQVRHTVLDGAAIAAMIGLTFSWALNGVAAKLALGGLNPVLLCVLRSAVGGLAVLGWCHWRRIDVFSRDGTLWAGIAAGALFGLEFALIFLSLDYTSVARSTLMTNTMPFWVLVGAHFLLGERMSMVKFGGLILAFAGVALVFSDELSSPGPDAYLGDLMALCSGLLWASTTLVIRTTRLASAGVEKILLYQLAVSSVIVLPLLPLGGALLRDIGPLVIAAFLYQSLVVVAFTYIVWFGLVRRYQAAALSSFTFLTPLFGVTLAGILLSEPLSVKIIAALLLIAIGLILVNRPAHPRNPKHA